MGYKYVIKGRPKSIYSIYNKLKKNNTPFEEIYDLFAVRVILDVPTEQEKAEKLVAKLLEDKAI